jgi:N,N'-diacetyllegionaminate synthase
MKIGSVDLDKDVLIVAEIGNNHEGDVALAEDLIAAAANAGAQAVKFQTIFPERLVAPDQVARLAQLRRFQLSAEDHARLAAAAKRAGVMFMSTPFCLEAVELLDLLVPAFKIASGDNNFLPLLEKVAETAKPIILSTGMADAAGIAFATAAIERVWSANHAAPGVVLLHCVSAYPTEVADANLRAITSLGRLGHYVGYSDHTLGVDAAVLSVGLGARVIEKHFTDSKTRSSFRDHALSANPREMNELVERVKTANILLGDGVKRTMDSEKATAAAARRSIASARDLPAGHVLSWQDLDWLRPSGGLAPGQEHVVLGKTLRAAVTAGTQLSASMVS